MQTDKKDVDASTLRPEIRKPTAFARSRWVMVVVAISLAIGLYAQVFVEKPGERYCARAGRPYPCGDDFIGFADFILPFAYFAISCVVGLLVVSLLTRRPE